ncbi:MAG: hypothetical protein ACFFCP_08295 [Promethearchaeota archaeon]
MDQRLKMLVVVALTGIISLAGVFLTEYTRQSITYSWAVEVGTELVYDISVVGNTSTGTQVLPPPFEPMNNTRIIVEINSLPNLTLYFYDTQFIQNVVEYPKTNSSLDDGSPIPAEYYFAINSRVSKCILPVGAWGHLDSLFPNHVNRKITDQESYISISGVDSFIFGYWINNTSSTSEWHGTLDLSTGIPTEFSFSIWSEGQPWSYAYTVTLTRVD